MENGCRLSVLARVWLDVGGGDSRGFLPLANDGLTRVPGRNSPVLWKSFCIGPWRAASNRNIDAVGRLRFPDRVGQRRDPVRQNVQGLATDVGSLVAVILYLTAWSSNADG